MIKILIADDHKIFADALTSLLTDSGRIHVTATATGGEEALRLIEANPDTDVLILDVSMPSMDGVEVLVELRRRHNTIPVLMLSQEIGSTTIMRAMKAGAAGYVLKTAGYDEFLTAITTVAAGGEYLSEGARSALIAGVTGRSTESDRPHLTRREIEVLKLIASGNTTNEIAERLFISAMTVETHRRNLLQKLQLKNVAGLVRYAVENGLTEESS
jgi:DNA-binding NarL/FixJ family response regulator